MRRFHSILSFSFLAAFAACSATSNTVVDPPDSPEREAALDGGALDASSDAVPNASRDAASDPKDPGDARPQADAQTCAPKTADCDMNGSCESNLLSGLAVGSDFLNCGRCGTTCQRTSRQVCGNGQCITPIDRDVVVFAADATAGYYLTRPVLGTLQFRTVAHASTAATTLVADTQLPTGDTAITLSVDDVFVSVRSSAGTTVFRAPKTGGPFTPFGSDTEGRLDGDQRDGIAVSSGFVFWTSRLGVYRQPLAGGAAELWAPTRCVKSLQATADRVLWSCYNGTIYYRDAAGAGTTSTQLSYDSGFAADATNLFYFASGGIYAKPLSGGASVLQVPTTSSGVLATDGVSFFWSRRQAAPSSTIALVTGQPGGTATEIVADSQVTNVVVGGRAVYFVQNAGDALWRLP